MTTGVSGPTGTTGATGPAGVTARQATSDRRGRWSKADWSDWSEPAGWAGGDRRVRTARQGDIGGRRGRWDHKGPLVRLERPARPAPRVPPDRRCRCRGSASLRRRVSPSRRRRRRVRRTGLRLDRHLHAQPVERDGERPGHLHGPVELLGDQHLRAGGHAGSVPGERTHRQREWQGSSLTRSSTSRRYRRSSSCKAASARPARSRRRFPCSLPPVSAPR